MTSIQCVDVHTLKNLIDTCKTEIKIIDVRELHEWLEIRIPHTIHIPKDEISDKIKPVEPNQETPLYLHCRSGVRSQHAALTLLNLGYTQVYSLEGGIIAWISAGYPTL